MSRLELAVASHRERERTIGFAKPTCGTTAALPRAFTVGWHLTNQPCRAPCACMLPEAVTIATVLARPGHEPSRRGHQSSLDTTSASLHNRSFSVNNLKLQSIRSVERTRSRSPDETLPTRCHAPTSCSECPSRCHPLSLSTRHVRTALTRVATLWPHDETARHCSAAFDAALHCGTMMLCHPRRLSVSSHV